MRESQGGDPAGDLAGRGGGLYFSASVGIFKDSTGGAAGKGLWKRYSTLFPCGEPRGGVWLFYVVSLAFAAGCTSFVKLV